MLEWAIVIMGYVFGLAGSSSQSLDLKSAVGGLAVSPYQADL